MTATGHERRTGQEFVAQDSPAYSDIEIRAVVCRLENDVLEPSDIEEIAATIVTKTEEYGLSIDEMDKVLTVLRDATPTQLPGA